MKDGFIFETSQEKRDYLKLWVQKDSLSIEYDELSLSMDPFEFTHELTTPICILSWLRRFGKVVVLDHPEIDHAVIISFTPDK